MISEQLVYAFNWSSWGSIIAGGVTAIAISIIMAILGIALGFTVVDPKSDEPASGLGMAFGFWSFISILVSMAGGGFIAGLLSGQRGGTHGFLVWAVVILVGTCFSSVAVGAAVRIIGSAVKSVGSGAADMATSMGKGAMHMTSGVISELRENVKLNLDSDKLTGDVVTVLRDTGIETLQPEYLHQQMREARSDLRSSLHQLSLNPGNSEEVISEFLEKEEQRLSSLTSDIDKEEAVRALMKVRNLPQPEAETMVNNAITAYNHALEKAKDSLIEAKEQIRDAKVYLKQLADQAREKADQMTSMAAKAALAAAVALIIAAFISAWAGMYGTKYSATWYPVQSTYLIR